MSKKHEKKKIYPDLSRSKDLSALRECSVMFHKEFPEGDSPEERKAARILCIKDSLLGALIITLIFMVVDQAAREATPWWSYLALAVVCYSGECMVNWKRYRKKVAKGQEKQAPKPSAEE